MSELFISSKRISCAFLLFFFTMAKAQVPDFSAYPVYQGNDLGLSYTSAQSDFRVYAPSSQAVQLNLYDDALKGEAYRRVDMKLSDGGTWMVSVKEDLNGKFYTYRVRINDNWLREVPDPYARIVGVNGRRAMVGDLAKSNPKGWASDKSPAFHHSTDAVIYEIHIRDASISRNSGIQHKGKFLGLAESGTKNSDGLATGLDHLKDLGITHVHLLPSFDFYSIDETQPDKPQYNWGYDPLNYNVPEGSYSTNATDGLTRIRELKNLVETMHSNGLRVVMDVVYNHTMLTGDSWFNQLVPGYYYRHKQDGSFSNATACNNETASERPMMRKFILESVIYWVQEYHIDGFRFDLMGVHDIETMNLIARELRAIKPDILLYGEGWTAGPSPLSENRRALKKNVRELDGIAVFNDDIRDGIKGSVFDIKDKGFVSGKPGMEESVKFGIVASTRHPQVKFDSVNYSKAPYATAPDQVITYCECHDNHVLWDKLALSFPQAGENQRKDMQKLALTIVLTSQGISFLHAGTEFLRTKKGVENSFESGDSINAIDWDMKTRNIDVYQYTRAVISMRKAHPAFRMTTAKEIAENLVFVQSSGNLISYKINGKKLGDSWKEIFVAFNGSGQVKKLEIPSGKWKVHIINNQLSPDKTTGSFTYINPYTATILYQR